MRGVNRCERRRKAGYGQVTGGHRRGGAGARATQGLEKGGIVAIVLHADHCSERASHQSVQYVQGHSWRDILAETALVPTPPLLHQREGLTVRVWRQA
eukprot:6178138-Pleurochrysis_carterae.AAC.4